MEEQILELLEILETEAISIGYGTMTIEVVLANGIPVVQSLVLTKVKVKKYGKPT